MLTRYPDLVYQDSPFLPLITTSHLQYAHQEMTQKRRPPSVAIAFALLEISLEINHYHNLDFGWVSQTFNASYEDLDHFMFGFTITPSLIIGSYIFDVAGPKAAFQNLCPPATDQFLDRLNSYKGGHLFVCYEHYKASKLNPKHTIKIFEHCQTNTFSFNKFYLAGIDASENLYQSLFQKVSISKKSD